MFLQVTLHELGHGMFDIYDIPVLGREEDAADQMAGFIMAQFGPEVARRTLPAGAYVWQKLYEAGGDWPRWLYSDEHGHSLQRSYNYLCMAYGADPDTFAYYVDSGLLPKERAVTCKHEFRTTDQRLPENHDAPYRPRQDEGGAGDELAAVGGRAIALLCKGMVGAAGIEPATPAMSTQW
jgi:Putative metallopeptidase